MHPAAEGLHEVLEHARAAGFLGPGPVGPHIRHAEGFAATAEGDLGRIPDAFADLGTGGGIPGLILAVRWTESRGVFVESGRRRCAWLREAVAALGLEARIEVRAERAEIAGRAAHERERYDLVTARSFAEPAVTAEIAAGLVAVGGILVVSEPPVPDPGRWPAEQLGVLGFEAPEQREFAGAHFVVVRKGSPTPDRFPRAVGRPAKRPLW